MINSLCEPLVTLVVLDKVSNKLSESEIKKIEEQTYKNLEIRIAQLGSNEPNNIINILENAKGKYILFWSVKDVMPLDYIRSVVFKAEKNNLDVVATPIGYISDNKSYYYNLDPLRIDNVCLNKDEIFDWFISLHFMSPSVYGLNNKIIKKDVINKSLKIYKQFFSEDAIISKTFRYALNISILYSSSSFANTPYNFIFTKKQEGVSVPKKGLYACRSFLKGLQNLISSEKKFNNIRNYFLRFFVNSFYSDEQKTNVSKLFSNLFNQSIEPFDDNDRYFTHLLTEIQDIYAVEKKLIKSIVSPDCKYVSFDMFDTLICRPCAEPKDCFCLLNDKFQEKMGASSPIDFVYMRQDAEKTAREDARSYQREEICIDDIYKTLGNKYGVSNEVCKFMMDAEIDLELQTCFAKESVYRIYELALYYNKKVVVASDMYLPESVLLKILQNAGYNHIDNIFVSCELQAQKASGKLFAIMAKKLNLSKEEYNSLIHIGDNYTSDFKRAKEFGFRSFHINSSMSIFKGGNSVIFGGDSYQNIYRKNTYYTRGKWQTEHYWGLRAFQGIVANKICDHPFMGINSKSDFDANPYVIGYYCLGGQLLALTKWLTEELKNCKNCTIHFVARDGWMVKQFYDMYTKNIKNAPKSNYLYVSRKSLFTADMKSLDDLLSILNNRMVVANSTPKKIIDLLKPLLTSKSYDKIINYYKRIEVLNTKFGLNENYIHFINKFKKNFGNLLQFKNNTDRYKAYFSKIIKPGDVIFDVGYSGRTESILSSILGFPINSFYVHANSDILQERQSKFNFSTKLFYQWRPNITGVIREYMLMKYSASVLGYDFSKKGNNALIFSDFENDSKVKWFTNILQKAAMDFCRDFLEVFGQFLHKFAANNYDLALPCEYYIQLAKPFDREIFSALEFEDDVSMGQLVNACGFWKDQYRLATGNLLYLNDSMNQSQKTTTQTVASSNPMQSITKDLLLPQKPLIKVKEKNKNNILLYSNELSWTGAPRSLLRIAKVLKKHNYNVEVWSLFDGPLKSEYQKLNIKVQICTHKDADYVYAKNKFDLCIVNAAVSYKFYYVISQYIPTIWYIREATNLPDLCRGNIGLNETLQKSIDMVCVSEYAKSYIETTYNANIDIVKNCVEDKYFEGEKTEKNDKLVLLTLGTIEPRKGYDVVLGALKLLPKDYAKRVEFRFAGRVLDFCRDWATQIIEEASTASNVKYLGEITEESDLHGVLANADVVIVPSRDESCSLVALEGAMHFKPLIVTENVGAKYMVTPDNGYVVQTSSAQSLADALIKMLDKSQNELESMGKKSREMYDEFASMSFYEKSILKMVENKLDLPKININPPKTTKRCVPVILATNQHYAPFVSVVAQSIIDNGSPDNFYDIYCFYTELGRDTVEKLTIEKQDKFRLVPVNISSILDADLQLRTCAHYTVETYYRFLVPEILHFYDKLVYVDCDVVVLDDIAKLLDTDLKGKTLGAIKNYMNDYVVNYVKTLKVEPAEYFNAGVLVMDTKRFIKNKIKIRSFSLLKERDDFIMLDQDALNVICKNQVEFISPEWNVQWHHFENKCDIVIDKQACIDAYAHPKILHFTGKNKPWKNARIPKSHLFWKYAGKTNFIFEIIQGLSDSKNTTIINTVSSSNNKPKEEIISKKNLKYYIKKFRAEAKVNGLRVALKKANRKIKMKVKSVFKRKAITSKNNKK